MVRLQLLAGIGIFCILQIGHIVGKKQPPNIMFILADDLGRTDVGFTEGNLQTPTPNIDKLAWDGIILNRHYTNSACTPTRSAILSGRYNFLTGMQQGVLAMGQPYGLPLNITIMPQFLKNLNYTTWMFGKWHTGTHKRAYFPGARGFDYWLGYPEGDINAFTYETGWPATNSNGRDLYENGQQVPKECMSNHYLPHVFLERLEQKIHSIDPSNYQPFYVQYNTPLPKAGAGFDGVVRSQPQFTMPEYNLRPAVMDFSPGPGAYGNDSYPDRKAQIQALDDEVGRIHEALKRRGVLDNTIIIFASDNGPATRQGSKLAGTRGAPDFGSSYPLRMFKPHLFEGGIRNVAFIWSPRLKNSGFISNQLFDVTDWLPTLYEAAGGNVSDLGTVSGISQWQSLKQGTGVGPRTETVNGIDINQNVSSIIWTDESGHLWKLIQGQAQQKVWSGCDCLFDITADPCELNNVADTYPDLKIMLQAKRDAYRALAPPAVFANTDPMDPASNPDLWGGWWVPWQDAVPVLPVNQGLCGIFNPPSAN